MRLLAKICLAISFIGFMFISLTAVANLPGAVFTSTNADSGQNGVIMYNRASDGTLSVTPGSPFLTGGYGTGPGELFPDDPLGTQGAIAVSDSNKFLFVVNSGSNEISSFEITPSGLNLVDKVSSGGVFPASLTTYDNMLYVLNAADHINFRGFKIGASGHLTPVANAGCDMLGPLNYFPLMFPANSPDQPAYLSTPGQISFTPDGSSLVISRKEGIPTPSEPPVGPGRIDIYELNDSGTPVDCDHPAVNINERAAIVEAIFPYAFTFSDKGHLLVTEVIGVGGAIVGGSALSSYKIKPSGDLLLKTGSLGNGEIAICWIDRSGRFVYASNTGSDSISLYEVAKSGKLTLISATAAIVGNVNPPSAFPTDLVVSEDGQYMYQLTPGTGLVHAFEINLNDGSLTPIGTASAGQPLSGQAGIATVDFKD